MNEQTPDRQPFAQMETLQIDSLLAAAVPDKAKRSSETGESEARDVPLATARLVPGIALQVSPIDNQKERLNSRLIGYFEGKTLIITTPQASGSPIALREGQKFLLRTFFGNSVVMFASSVLKSNLSPYPYAHLSCPSSVKVKSVRRATRVSTSLIANASNLNSEHNQNCSCRIVDLSVNGAMVVARHPIAALGDRLVLKFRVSTDVGEHYISNTGAVRSAEPSGDDGVRYGLQFGGLDPEQSLVVENFIYRSLLDE